MKILITGTAGFIGYHLVNSLINEGHEVVGLDNINNYYDVSLKIDRLESSGINRRFVAYKEIVISEKYPNYRFIQMRLEDGQALNELFRQEQFDMVCHLAAQAGVRYSIKNPRAYVNSNIIGFSNILESCRNNPVKHLVYASSSSVYGLNKNIPFSTSDNVDHPVSLYAATKKSNELMAHSYSHLYDIPTTGLRFFTVYGPWGRPDMAYFLFTNAIIHDKPIKVFNHGKMSRDFTYIGDIVDGIKAVMANPPQKQNGWNPEQPDPSFSSAPYRIYNIGNNKPTNLLDFITTIEDIIGKEAQKEMMPMQAGDVEATYADVEGLIKDFNYQPNTPLRVGLEATINWYIDYYNIKL